jgi:hypothetical protein
MATGNPFSYPQPKPLFLMIELQYDTLRFSFPDLRRDAKADMLLRQFLEEFLQPLHVGCEQLRISLCEGFVDR